MAAYYLISESLANIGKYAQASSATIGVVRGNGDLHVEVADDGIGALTSSAARVYAALPTEWRLSAGSCGFGARMEAARGSGRKSRARSDC